MDTGILYVYSRYISVEFPVNLPIGNCAFDLLKRAISKRLAIWIYVLEISGRGIENNTNVNFTKRRPIIEIIIQAYCKIKIQLIPIYIQKKKKFTF